MKDMPQGEHAADAIAKLDPSSATKTFLQRVPRDFAREHLVLSQGTEDGSEILATANTTDPAAVFNLGVRLGREVKRVLADSEDLARSIDKSYGGSTGATSDFDFALENADHEDLEQLIAEVDRDLLSTQGKGPVVKFVDALLLEALGKSASDIHVQPLADRVLVRFRVDGRLHTVREIPSHVAAAIVSRIKVMGRMDIAERRVAQDGRCTITLGPRAVDLRISTFPTSYGERAVLRLLDNTSTLFELNSIGMPENVKKNFLECATQPNGIVLVTGPTGSGKTTTLYSTLRTVSTPELNIMTIEDPIEYELATVGLAVSQAQVNSKKGVTFATGLRHILRQDPDVVLVGEIRDAETARMAIQSSLTGHLVFSTLHTNDAPSAITRLLDLGVEPYLLSASLSAILAQRLVRTIHTDCHGLGCTGCFNTGLQGRTGIFELVVVDDAIRHLIAEGAELDEFRKTVAAAGTRSLSEEGRRLVDEGKSTSMEVARVVQTR